MGRSVGLGGARRSGAAAGAAAALAGLLALAGCELGPGPTIPIGDAIATFPLRNQYVLARVGTQDSAPFTVTRIRCGAQLHITEILGDTVSFGPNVQVRRAVAVRRRTVRDSVEDTPVDTYLARLGTYRTISTSLTMIFPTDTAGSGYSLSLTARNGGAALTYTGSVAATCPNGPSQQPSNVSFEFRAN